MGGAEGVVDVDVGVGGECLGELALPGFELLLGGGFHLVGGVGGQAAGFALFLGVEAEVLEQQHFAWLQCGGFQFGFLTDAIGGELHIDAKELGYVLADVSEGVLVVHCLGPAEV